MERPNMLDSSPRREQAPRPARNNHLLSPPELRAPRRRNHSSQQPDPRDPRQSNRPQCSRRQGADRDIITWPGTDLISLAARPGQLSREGSDQHQDHRGATLLARNVLETTGAIAVTLVQATTASDDAVGSPLDRISHRLPQAAAARPSRCARERQGDNSPPSRSPAPRPRPHPPDRSRLGLDHARDLHSRRRSSAAASTRAAPNAMPVSEHQGTITFPPRLSFGHHLVAQPGREPRRPRTSTSTKAGEPRRSWLAKTPATTSTVSREDAGNASDLGTDLLRSPRAQERRSQAPRAP